MITDLTQFIIEWVIGWVDLSGDCPISEDPKIIWKLGSHLAYKDEEKGVLLKSSNEFQYSGIDDRKGNFLYIRHVDDEKIMHNPIDEIVSSCTSSVQETASLRLVSVIQSLTITTGLERYQVEEYIRNALLNIDWKTYTGIEEKPKIELTQSWVNSLQILDEERGPKDEKRSRGFPLNYLFTAIDFILKYNYHAEPKT